MSAACPVRGGNLGNAGCLVLPVEGSGLDLIQAPKPEPRAPARAVSVENLLRMLTAFDQDVEITV
jgi:hypothetical protein